MQRQLTQVAEFHRSIGEKVAESTELLESDSESDRALATGLRDLIAAKRSHSREGSHLSSRALMAIEELAEWIEAHVAGDLVEAADAIGDRLYVLLGDAVASGLPLEQVFDEVHRSNMTKHASHLESGKGTKTGKFDAPKLDKLLNSSPVESLETCGSCRFQMQMIGIGQGVQCKHPNNQTTEGKWMQIPNRNFVCTLHETTTAIEKCDRENG